MTINSNTILEINDLTKRYPGKRRQSGHLALDHLNLTVHQGEIFGYLGPNGAGKTTTIRLLLNLIRPTEGSVQIMGLDVQADSVAVRKQLGNLPSEVRLWDHLTGMQVLRYLCGLRPGCDLNYALELAERLNLDLNVLARKYSTGNKRKLGIIQAFMHRPQLLILDEPTMGLDPLIAQTFNQLLLEAQHDGRTVFLSSHVLSEVEQVCNRVAVLRGGKLQAVERISDLRHKLYRWVTILTRAQLEPAVWAELDGVSDVRLLPNGIHMSVSGSIDPVIKLAARYPVDDMTIEEPSLEDFFMTFYDEAAHGNHS
jgi:ABC-2 type transport system ATP-binding protein